MNSFSVATSSGGTITVSLGAEWSIRGAQPSLSALAKLVDPPAGISAVILDGSRLDRWDSALLAFLVRLASYCRDKSISVDDRGLPSNARQLVSLAQASAQHAPTAPHTAKRNLIWRFGEAVLRKTAGMREPVDFVGASLITVGQFFLGRARYRTSDIMVVIQQCGAEALPIVGIIAFLVGMIFAFVGALQLKQFGADIYDANLVAVAMFREMGAVMTGIVLAGRSGAAFAAEIAAMQGNEEIDALSTLGIPAMEFLVLPRMIALIVMIPLLCIYADLLGLAGGYVVAMGTLNVTSTAYLLQTQSAVTLTDFSIGIFKGAVFGALIALTGCLRGMQAGRSAVAVGAAATSAVVSGILAIIITDAIFAVLLNFLKL